MGQLIEKYHFHYIPNNESRPDFPEAGLELKTSPIKTLKNGEFRVKERRVLNIINYIEEYKLTWESSSFWKKNKRLLLMYYLYENKKSLLDFVFKLVGNLGLPPRRYSNTKK